MEVKARGSFGRRGWEGILRDDQPCGRVAGVNRVGSGATASGAAMDRPIPRDSLSPDDRAACTHCLFIIKSIHDDHEATDNF
jgi:hypothetical protein